MTTYEITDNRTGKVYEISGDRQPTEQEIDELIQSTLPKPSVEERVLANAIYTGSDAKRRAFLMQQGKNPNEPGFFYDEPGIIPKARELWADVAETIGGAGSKLGAQFLGEKVGGAAGSVLGPVGTVAGYTGGGAAGRGITQAIAEGYAKSRGMDVGESTAVREGALGAVTSGIGRLMGYGAKALGKLDLGKKFEEFALTNLTRMPKPMQEWMANRWTEITNLAKTPKEAFTKMYDRAYGSIKNLLRKQDELGEAITRAKNDILYPKGNKPEMVGLLDEVKSVVDEYRPNITSKEADSMLNAAGILEKYGGNVIEQLPTKAQISTAVTAGQITEEQAASYATQEMVERIYSKALDTLVLLGRKAKVQQSSALSNLSSSVKSIIDKRVVPTSPYAQLSKSLDDLGSHLSEANLKDPTKRDAAMKFLQENLFNEESIAANQSLSDTLTKHLGPTVVKDIKDLAAAHFARRPELLASFGKLTIGGLIGRYGGGGIGYLLGGEEGYRRGRDIGSVIGLGSSLPYASPAFATATHRLAERFPGVSDFTNRSAIAILTHSPKLLASPLAQSVKETSQKFGVDPTEEDLKILKSSRSKALSTP